MSEVRKKVFFSVLGYQSEFIYDSFLHREKERIMYIPIHVLIE